MDFNSKFNENIESGFSFDIMFKHFYANLAYSYSFIFLVTRHFEEEIKERILLLDLPYIWSADFSEHLYDKT